MIELELTISCVECGEEETLNQDDLMDVVNFGSSVIACWALEKLPEGFVVDPEDEDEILCTKCSKERESNEESVEP